MGHARQILIHSMLYLAFVGICIFGFIYTRISVFLFAPLATAILLILFTRVPVVTLGLLLVYTGFEGMFKILSGYNPILYAGTDILLFTFSARCLVIYRLQKSDEDFQLAPLASLFLIHALWVGIEVLNPYGFGWITIIAAYKVYIGALLLYFFSYHFLREPQELKSLMIVAVAIMMIEAFTSIQQFSGGQNSVLALSPNYAKPMADKFVGIFFRPFGTTHLPGGPCVWIFLTMPLLASLILTERSIFKKTFWLVMLLPLPYVLLICQVRSAMLKAAIGFSLAFILASWRKPVHLMAILTLIIAIPFFTMPYLRDADPRLQVAQKRFEGLFDKKTLLNARGEGVWESMLIIFKDAPFGTGVGRVGASSGLWSEKVQNDPFWGPEWGFADNLYRAVTVETGIPGFILFLSFIYFPAILVTVRVLRARPLKGSALPLVAGCTAMAIGSIAGHYGSEGSLYLPEAAYYWIFLGAAMRFTEKPYLLGEAARHDQSHS